MNVQQWNEESYAKHARFVTDLGAPVLELLAPQSGERILDVGCGDGVLTQKIAAMGCDMVGLDLSPEFVRAARRHGLKVVECSAAAMNFNQEFDAVFSNAALHWIKDADAVIAGAARALKTSGRFVAEMGGHGCVATLVSALSEELELSGYDPKKANPWYFPTVEEYGGRLTAAGFKVDYIALIERPTALPGDVMGWLTTFAGCFTAALPAEERFGFLSRVRERIRPKLCDASGRWTADYVRLRFKARLP